MFCFFPGLLFLSLTKIQGTQRIRSYSCCRSTFLGDGVKRWGKGRKRSMHKEVEAKFKKWFPSTHLPPSSTSISQLHGQAGLEEPPWGQPAPWEGAKSTKNGGRKPGYHPLSPRLLPCPQILVGTQDRNRSVYTWQCYTDITLSLRLRKVFWTQLLHQKAESQTNCKKIKKTPQLLAKTNRFFQDTGAPSLSQHLASTEAFRYIREHPGAWEYGDTAQCIDHAWGLGPCLKLIQNDATHKIHSLFLEQATDLLGGAGGKQVSPLFFLVKEREIKPSDFFAC